MIVCEIIRCMGVRKVLVSIEIVITGIVCEIQTLRKINRKNYFSRFITLCEIVVSKYTIVPLKRNFLIKNG